MHLNFQRNMGTLWSVKDDALFYYSGWYQNNRLCSRDKSYGKLLYTCVDLGPAAVSVCRQLSNDGIRSC